MKADCIMNRRAVTAASIALLAGVSTPALAQAGPAEDRSNADIIVTAQRVEQRLQDVPISITVFNEEQINNNNIVSPKDLATFTPGLTVSTRSGNDATTFTIRGFSQEQRTTATVATYFGDVVVPRGGGVNAGGDGAGPGQLFDLQNIQVLKGPQGTLFGRNTTGGAVLLVPRKPVDRFEGYVEGSLGDYDLRRVQAVVNVPIADSFRVRLGADRYLRDGYMQNFGLGRKDLGNVDYWSFRASAVADLSPDVENYTILSYAKSKSAGVVPKLGLCFPNATTPGFTSPTLGQQACAQVERGKSRSFWSVENSLPTSRSEVEQWQVINTTTARLGDNLTVKNIFSYAEFRGANSIELYGSFFPLFGKPASSVTSPADVLTFTLTNAEPLSGYTNAQSTLVEELQFQGAFANGRLNWQAGLYFESNRPLDRSGSMSPTFTPCSGLDPLTCRPQQADVSAGAVSTALFQNTNRSVAAYAQASYDITDSLKLTGGLRYTEDRSSSHLQIMTLRFPAAGAPYGACVNPSAPGFGTTFPQEQRYAMCNQHIAAKSSAPTWLVGLDFKPIDSVLLYAKYTRGYRQGSVAPFAPDGYQFYDPERVDSYEAGVKSSWRGAVPGTFNLSGFYNDFQDQQLQVGLLALSPQLVSTTSIENVGKSRIYGGEAELTVSPFTGLQLGAAYAYLKTKLVSVAPFTSPAGYLAFPPNEGGELPFAPRHQLTANAAFTLPLPESVGKVTIGGTFIYKSGYLLSSQAYARLPGYKHGNANLTWEGVAGYPVDLGLFVTNVTNKKMYNNAIDQSRQGGFVSYGLAEPRIWGVRMRYSFGE